MRDQDQGRIVAFQRLADENLYASYRLANAILGSKDDSQDAVHDAVVTAWQRWPTLRDKSRFQPWFNRIVVNACRNRLKSSSRKRTTDISAEAAVGTSDSSADVHRRIQVEQAFAVLKPDDVVVFALRHFVDLQLEDIALLLDLPLATAKTRLRSARKRLRGLIEEPASSEVSQ